MSENVEIVGVLVAGLAIFVSIMRYVTLYTKNADKRRLEVLSMYENTLIENAKLKGQIELSKIQEVEVRRNIQAYKTEITRYKNLYEKTLDKNNNKV